MTAGRHAGRSCPSGKLRYGDRVGALLALAQSASSSKAKRNEVRAYRCPRCDGWHLTSKGAYSPPTLEPRVPGQRPYQAPGLGAARVLPVAPGPAPTPPAGPTAPNPGPALGADAN
jgi:hypothetical protein